MALDAQHRCIRCGGGHINRRCDEIHSINFKTLPCFLGSTGFMHCNWFGVKSQPRVMKDGMQLQPRPPVTHPGGPFAGSHSCNVTLPHIMCVGALYYIKLRRHVSLPAGL